jgi:hypothetical protein
VCALGRGLDGRHFGGGADNFLTPEQAPTRPTVAAHSGVTTTTGYWLRKDAIDGFKDAPAHRELDSMLDRDYWGWSGAPDR